ILSKVATTIIRDFGSARVAFPEFNAIGRENYFYKSANLIFMNDKTDEVNAASTFRLKSYNLGNPEAIYLQGMYEFFILHLLDEGREKIHLAAERECLLAKYVDGMMNLAFSVDDRGLNNRTSVCSLHRWIKNTMEMRSLFMAKCSLGLMQYGSRTQWKCDLCLWQSTAWDLCNVIHLIGRDWPIGN
ncbi:hypothetical protein HID58_070283, partial [Brassica napus]